MVLAITLSRSQIATPGVVLMIILLLVGLGQSALRGRCYEADCFLLDSISGCGWLHHTFRPLALIVRRDYSHFLLLAGRRGTLLV